MHKYPRAFEAQGSSLKCLPENSLLCDITHFLGIVPSQVVCITNKASFTTPVSNKLPEDVFFASTDNWKCMSLQGWNTVNLIPNCRYLQTQNKHFSGTETCAVSYDISELNRDISILCILIIVLSILCCCLSICTISFLLYKFYKKQP